MDSRHYIIVFPIHSTSEVPADFVLPSGLGAVGAGVFLPQADPDWVGRRKYPARILLLAGREVVVAAHPSSGEPPARIPLARIQTVECGRILLLGWIVFSWDGGERRLPYNTRTRGPVEAFLKTFMDQWLPPASGVGSRSQDTFGKPLNLRFEHAWSTELLAGETPLVQFFHPVVFRTCRRWLLRREDSLPGDLLVMTSRRLLWITERHRGRYAPYGTVSRSVPPASIAGVECIWGDRGAELAIALRSGDSWHVPLREDGVREGREFEAAYRKVEDLRMSGGG